MDIRCRGFVTLISLFHCVNAIVFNADEHSTMLEAAALTAHGVQSLYKGNQSGEVLGKWPFPPYYWWESGGAWGGMLQHWHATGDRSYEEVIMQALVSQLGPNYDFVIAAEKLDEGNDDQGFWALNAMTAAEYNFPEPPAPAPAWFVIATAAWHDYVNRWNYSTCNGGLQWQFYPQNAGFTYKQTIANGVFFQLSARLGRFTGNQIYIDWANKIWDWVTGIGLVDASYNVYDGTDDTINCTGVDHHQWSYNVGVFLYGAATMSNYTNASTIWVNRTEGLLAASSVFFTPFTNASNIMFEHECELSTTCDTDQQSMKAYFARWLATTSILAPYTSARIGQLLRSSAIGAASACTGGPYGNTCGTKWYINDFDGVTGLGQELSAMEVFVGVLVNGTTPPRTQPNVTILMLEPQQVHDMPATYNPSATAPRLHDDPVPTVANASAFSR